MRNYDGQLSEPVHLNGGLWMLLYSKAVIVRAEVGQPQGNVASIPPAHALTTLLQHTRIYVY